MAKVEHLGDEFGEPLCFEELEVGMNVFWSVDEEAAYPVTVVKILTCKYI